MGMEAGLQIVGALVRAFPARAAVVVEGLVVFSEFFEEAGGVVAAVGARVAVIAAVDVGAAGSQFVLRAQQVANAAPAEGMAGSQSDGDLVALQGLFFQPSLFGGGGDPDPGVRLHGVQAYAETRQVEVVRQDALAQAGGGALSACQVEGELLALCFEISQPSS